MPAAPQGLGFSESVLTYTSAVAAEDEFPHRFAEVKV